MKLTKIFRPLKRKRNLIIFLILLILTGATAAYFMTKGTKPVVEAPIPGKKYYSQLTGNEVEKDISDRPILGVMIENSEDARPQTGLDEAGIVFETVTEAGITRYLVLYQENIPVEVGPVRSIRPYFVDWVMGMDATVAHVGGSDEALEMVEQRNAKSINEFFNEGAFYRSAQREAPHNAYAKTEYLIGLQKQLGHQTSKIKDFARSDDAPSAQPTASVITVNYSIPIFEAQFKFDPTTNTYARSLAGQPHVDAVTSKQITVKNVVVVKMGGDIQALGSGDAVLYKDGASQNIHWRQKDYTSRIELLDDQGKEVQLNRGDTWFAVIPGSGSVSNQ